MMSEDADQLLVVYDDHSDQRSLSLDETSSTEESPDETKLSLETTNDAVPYIGQRFATHDAAYEFYSEFAKRCGFSIRRHRTEGKDGVGKGLTRRYFVCHRAGNTPVKTLNENKPQRNRKSSRCGCQAYMRISKTTELGAPEWRVTGFSNHHNHELLEPNQVRFLPAYRTISDIDKNRILMFAKTGISVQQMMRLMELEKCVEPGYLPFTEKDAFLGFMNGKVPQTILTDQTLCVREAIAMEMPAAKHAYCIWLIVAKFPSWFNAVLGERYNEWKGEFYRLYNLEAIEDFEMGWRDMVNSFGLHTNRHINTLFASRTLWALPYLRSHFFAGMTTTGHSKAINAFIQRFLSAQTRLAHFIEQVAVAVDFKDQAGEQQTMQQNLQNICLKTGAPMESHAASILTPFAFSKLQEQLVMAAHYASFQLEDGFLVRHHTKLEGGRKVYWVPREGIISCSCHHFEFSGILCRHALRVLSTGNCFQIPERYMPLRWRRINTSAKLLQNTLSDHAERVQLLQGMVSNLVTESAKSKDRLDIAVEHVSILLSRIREHPVPSARYARTDLFT
ncbi:FAR1 DNA binding domain-containing protein [Cynara cardunculus var. scolymus]|uniref:Protein FAR1-RELATED SEQUENCE n=1 Tax=Cynara cardunculus var. scolymus TaxID=59895 RepID=A0A103XML8_CYNCS|nr:FAR1 DNA binding domain-containing protein [Cynara cardunculus var. scolymus]